MRICVTPGEPAGVGPDILLKSIQSSLECELIAIASPELLLQRAALLGLELKLNAFDPNKFHKSGNSKLSIIPISLGASCKPGELNLKNAEYVLKTLSAAHQLCEQGHAQAVITGPVQKSILSVDNIFRGHTEFFAECCQVDPEEILMCFYHPKLIVGLVTTHYGLLEVPKHITTKRLQSAIRLLQEGCHNFFKLKDPDIAVIALNPHAGEMGQLGIEEETIIKPTLDSLKQQYPFISGPYPADTAFTPKMRDKHIVYLSMYHDQGLIPIKTLYFNQITNVTLGLPYLRTSVDHGTALNVAGTKKACNKSFTHVLQQTMQFL